jgi:integrase/recombinase XerD
MAQPKYTLYKYVRLKGGSWRYRRAALYANRTVKPDLVLVGGKEEKHPEGNYYIYHAGQRISAGPDALAALRQQHALLHGNASEYRLYSSDRQMPEPLEPQPSADTARKKIKEEITAYLDDLILSKRPAKTVRMRRNFLTASADLIGKEHADEYRREDVLVFSNSLIAQECAPKYVDTQMNVVVTFFKQWLKMPIRMEKKDWPECPPKPPEPYMDENIVAMERTAKDKFNLLIRLFRSTGCRLQEVTHLTDKDIDPRTKCVSIHQKPCKDCSDCRAQGGIWKPKTPAGTREIPISDPVAELFALPEGLLFPDKHGKVEGHMLREIQKAVKGSGVPKIKIHRFRDTFAVNKLRDGVDVRTLQVWLGHETVEQVMEYCAWLDSQSEAARKHANKEETRYVIAAD